MVNRLFSEWYSVGQITHNMPLRIDANNKVW